MRVAVVLGILALSGTSASAAVDVARLPDSCKTLMSTIQNDKPHYKQLGGIMAQARKAKNMGNFCFAAKQTLALITLESGQVDPCLGDLAVDKTQTQATVGQFTEIKTYYRKMLAAAKDPANDHMRCGLAN